MNSLCLSMSNKPANLAKSFHSHPKGGHKVAVEIEVSLHHEEPVRHVLGADHLLDGPLDLVFKGRAAVQVCCLDDLGTNAADLMRTQWFLLGAFRAIMATASRRKRRPY